MTILSLFISAVCLAELASAHSALTIPCPRNAVDSNEKPWGGPVPHPLPLGVDVPVTPWCFYPSSDAFGIDDRNLTGANGQACFWFSNGCAIGCDKCDGSTRGPGPSFNCNSTYCEPNRGQKDPVCKSNTMKATICDPKQRTVNTAVECGGPYDWYYYSPWRAPGYAPVIDSCGTAGGRYKGQGNGAHGAQYRNTTHSKIGDLGSLTLQKQAAAPIWKAGSIQSVAWTIQANHGGGYSYRLCPANETLNEDCFNRIGLDMVGRSMLRWGGEGGRELEFDAVTVTEGTKAGIMWRRNPIPRAWHKSDGTWGDGSNHHQTGMGFQPPCDPDVPMDRQGVNESCVGMWGPYNLEIVDKVQIPDDIPAGDYVLNWRMDQEESNQIWQNCADVAVTVKA